MNGFPVILQGAEEVWSILLPVHRFIGCIEGENFWLCPGNDGYWYKSKTAGPHKWERMTSLEVMSQSLIHPGNSSILEA